MVPQIGKSGSFDLKHEGEFTEIITDQYIQPAICIEVVQRYAFPGLVWHIMGL